MKALTCSAVRCPADSHSLVYCSSIAFITLSLFHHLALSPFHPLAPRTLIPHSPPGVDIFRSLASGDNREVWAGILPLLLPIKYEEGDVICQQGEANTHVGAEWSGSRGRAAYLYQ